MPKFQLQKKIKIEWSSNFAYAIGLLASDGYLLSDGRHIGIKSKDLELVEDFKKALGLNNKVGKGVRGGEKVRKYYYDHFGDKSFYGFLNSIGLTSAKSRTIKKVDVPKIFFRDFVRGLFDGDGTFYSSWDKRWPNSFIFQIAFCSASLDFMLWLKSNLTKFYSVKGFIREGDRVYNLRYVKGDTKKLFCEMYYKNGLLFLSRKYIKINNALKKDAGLAHR